MIKKQPRNKTRKFRHQRVRKKLTGTAERPRLVVFRSLKHVYAQVVDDTASTTLVAASSLDESLKGEKLSLRDKATKVGALAAERALEKGIEEVIFDRGGYKYHGRIAALADAAREKGLRF